MRAAMLAALAALLTIAAPARAVDIGVSVGSTYLETPFEHSRFAFPDLAQSGACCNSTTYTQDHLLSSMRVTASQSFGSFGVESALAYLGTSHIWFDVSGPFGNSVKGPGYGRCVESGDFNMASASVAGTYTKAMLGVDVTGKLGLAGNWLFIKTHSHCDLANLTASVDVDRDYSTFSISPLVGIGVSRRISEDTSVVFDIEARRMLFSNNDEANRYGQGYPVIATAWLGLERRF